METTDVERVFKIKAAKGTVQPRQDLLVMAWGNKNPEVLAEDLRGGPAEQFFAARVPAGNGAGVVNLKGGIECRV